MWTSKVICGRRRLGYGDGSRLTSVFQLDSCVPLRVVKKDATRAFGVSPALRAAVEQRMDELLAGGLKPKDIVPPKPDLIEQWKKGRLIN